MKLALIAEMPGRKFGYSLRGKPAKAVSLYGRGKHLSAISAISVEGNFGCHITEGGVDAEVFQQFLDQYLIPKLMPFNGTNPHSVVILDNAAIHHGRLYMWDGLLLPILILLPPFALLPLLPLRSPPPFSLSVLSSLSSSYPFFHSILLVILLLPSTDCTESVVASLDSKCTELKKCCYLNTKYGASDMFLK